MCSQRPLILRLLKRGNFFQCSCILLLSLPKTLPASQIAKIFCTFNFTLIWTMHIQSWFKAQSFPTFQHWCRYANRVCAAFCDCGAVTEASSRKMNVYFLSLWLLWSCTWARMLDRIGPFVWALRPLYWLTFFSFSTAASYTVASRY